MRISIIGYGRMGQAIERMAKDRGHEIGYINNGESIDLEAVKATDVAIEFTQPDAALKTITSILGTETPVISGTTGWLDQKSKADEAAKENETAFLYASNFSLGVNLFFVINEKLSALMKDHKMYTPSVHEIHHTGKKRCTIRYCYHYRRRHHSSVPGAHKLVTDQRRWRITDYRRPHRPVLRHTHGNL